LGIPDPVSWWARATELVGGDILPLRASHVSALAGLPSIHRDPFDRMLVAQSTTEGLALITSNPHIAQYRTKVVW